MEEHGAACEHKSAASVARETELTSKNGMDDAEAEQATLGGIAFVNDDEGDDDAVPCPRVIFRTARLPRSSLFRPREVCAFQDASGAGRGKKGDSTPLQLECSRSDAREKSIHALGTLRRMIARPNMS